MTSARPYHAAVLLQVYWGSDIKISEGIRMYERQSTQCGFVMADPEKVIGTLRRGDADGAILNSGFREYVQAVQKAGVPAIDISTLNRTSPFPRVVNDDEATGRLAAEHLLGQGMRRFAFYGYASHWYSCLRQKAFAERLAAAGHVPDLFITEEPFLTPQVEPRKWAALLNWLDRLEKPVGIFACCDDRALKVVLSCEHLGIRIPEQVAVIGTDNDGWDPRPNPTTVECDFERVGYEAAALLVRMLEGERAPQAPVLLPPKRILSRWTTDLLAIEEPYLAQAIRFIRSSAHKGIHVEDVLRRVPVSRRWLEMQFQKVLGRSPAGEIRRARIEYAKQLLDDPGLSVETVARRSGFASAPLFCRAFRHGVGMTPSEYRGTRHFPRGSAA